MANRIPLLEQRLLRVETRTQGIIEAASQHVDHPATTDVWWPHLVTLFGSEAVLFATKELERDVFDKRQDSEGKRSGTICELNKCFVFGFVGILVL